MPVKPMPTRMGKGYWLNNIRNIVYNVVTIPPSASTYFFRRDTLFLQVLQSLIQVKLRGSMQIDGEVTAREAGDE